MLYQLPQPTNRQRSLSNQLSTTPRQPTKVQLQSGIDNGAALRKSDQLQLEQLQHMIYAKNQEIAMMKQHIQQLEQNLKQYEQSTMQHQINRMADQMQLIIDSHNLRTQELEQLKQSQGHNHTDLERQVLQLLNENSQLISRFGPCPNESSIEIKRSKQGEWKSKFMRLNKEYHRLQERLVLALAELDQHTSRSPSLASIEQCLRF